MQFNWNTHTHTDLDRCRLSSLNVKAKRVWAIEKNRLIHFIEMSIGIQHSDSISLIAFLSTIIFQCLPLDSFGNVHRSPCVWFQLISGFFVDEMAPLCLLINDSMFIIKIQTLLFASPRDLTVRKMGNNRRTLTLPMWEDEKTKQIQLSECYLQ